MKSVLLSNYGVKLSVKGRMFILSSKEKKETISPADVDQFVIISSGISISSKAIRLAMEYGIDMVFLDNRKNWARICFSNPIMTVENRKAQYIAILQGRKEFGEEIIRAKVENQAGHIKYWSRKIKREDFSQILNYTNNEATAARIYWSMIADLLPNKIGFEGRNHDSKDVFNISLNYAYAILYSECHKALSLVGLDPYAGFIHKDRSGNESLVYDFSEMFKPGVVDFTLMNMILEGYIPQIRDSLLSPDSRKEIIKRINTTLNSNVKDSEDGEVRTFLQTIRVYAMKMSSSLKGKENFRGFVQRW
ncbi:CRISPR-associated endonuclease Cas1 [Acidianus brierleyi]|uniref:CRISPR-associated endonuclease Cas1 n=1 Tax=Acidianus brierleyi TaxID=41673 RepID=A0A2U9IGX9_9CREN|nr:CRISPR-associated endonuclease Cas1 [Acidianus brierleyi]AWR95236.1 CRISPR-associated endonuclease Cas1 [Acidianus brierleyi]